jgi:hypothetical protein
MKRKLPWIDKDTRKRMEYLRNDLERQLARTRDRHKVAELERQIITLSRELDFDKS